MSKKPLIWTPDEGGVYRPFVADSPYVYSGPHSFPEYQMWDKAERAEPESDSWHGYYKGFDLPYRNEEGDLILRPDCPVAYRVVEECHDDDLLGPVKVFEIEGDVYDVLEYTVNREGDGFVEGYVILKRQESDGDR